MDRSASKIVSVAGSTIHVDVGGNGEPILFIQGVGVPSQGWRPQTDALADRFTVARFDNRGVGRSQPVGDAPITVARMADDAIAVLDALGWPSAHLVGHSLGGLVALDVALRFRDRVKSLALLCTFANGRECAPPTPRMLWWGARSRLGTRAMRRRGFLHLIVPAEAIGDADAQAAALAPLFGRDLGESPRIVDAQLRALRRANYGDRLGELAGLRTLVMCATHDLIAPPRLGRALAAGIPGATFVETRDAAHGLPITHAALVNERLAAHVAAT